jgi:hypothetical protein
MNREASALGHDFSRWARLTESYAREVEALRREEPGASMRLMRIAHALMQHQDPFSANPPDSEHMPLPLRFAPPRPGRPGRPVGPTWGGRVRKTLQGFGERLRTRGTEPAPGQAQAQADPPSPMA